MPRLLIHVEPLLVAPQLIGRIGHLLREEKLEGAFAELYCMARSALEHCAEAEERRRKRLRLEEVRLAYRQASG